VSEPAPVLTIDFSIQSGSWPEQSELASMLDKTLSIASQLCPFDLPQGAEVSVVFCDDENIQVLNQSFRDEDKPTNVLSFASNDHVELESWSPLLGDVILAQETIEREAKAQDKTFTDHMTHLLVHGFLHLVGYDHMNDEDAEDMENMERKILAELHIADPYLEA
jgi:probable rRNA maturation factor